MALSCYVLQNVLASAAFYGWGLVLTGKTGPPGTLAVWFEIRATLILFSHLWLERFSSGPFEAVWRKHSLLSFGTDEKR
jgi:uncharacterized protein